MSLDRAAVAKIAKLARLKMEPDRLEAMTSELNRILSFVAVSYTHLTLPTICSV